MPEVALVEFPPKKPAKSERSAWFEANHTIVTGFSYLAYPEQLHFHQRGKWCERRSIQTLCKFVSVERPKTNGNQNGI